MEEFWNQFLGDHDISFHIAGLLFALMGTLLVKWYHYKKHVAECQGVHDHSGFSIKHWMEENGLDSLASIVASFVAVRFIDVLLHWLNPKIEAGFGFSIPVTEDQIFYYLIVGALITMWIHKLSRKKKE